MDLVTQLLTTKQPPFKHKDPAERLEAIWVVSADRWYNPDFTADESDEKYASKIDDYLESCGYTIRKFVLPGSPLDRYGHKNVCEWTAFEYKLVNHTISHCCQGPAHGLFITDEKYENLLIARRAGFKHIYLIYLVLSEDESRYDLFMFSRRVLLKAAVEANLNGKSGISIDPLIHRYNPRTSFSKI